MYAVGTTSQLCLKMQYRYLVLTLEKERRNHQLPWPDKHCYKSISVSLYHLKLAFLPLARYYGQTYFAFSPPTEINPRSLYELAFLLLHEDSFVTWNYWKLYENSTAIEFHSVIFQLIFRFSVSKQYIRARFYQSNVQPYLFILVMLGIIMVVYYNKFS